MLLQSDTFAVSQRHQPIVVHHRIHVLYPQCINIAVEKDVAQLFFVRRKWAVYLSEDAG